MSNSPNAVEILDREFLELRAKVLQVAATLDRLERAEGSASDDPRMELVRQAIEVLRDAKSDDRAEQIQLIFSRPYDEAWRDTFFADGK